MNIDVTGYRYSDIVIYVAGILAGFGERVVVSDYSRDEVLFNYLPEVRGLEAGNEIELKGVTYTRRNNCEPESGDIFHFRIWDIAGWMSGLGNQRYGTWVCENDLDNLREWPRREFGDMSLYVTEEDPVLEKKIDECMRLASLDEAGYSQRDLSIVVLRDCINNFKYSMLSLVSGGSRNKYLRLPYSEKDRKAELYLCSREDALTKPVSEKMAALLEQLVIKIRPGTAAGEFERAYRTVMRGGAR